MSSHQSLGNAVVDREKLLENLGGDHELLLELLSIFTAETGPLLAAVQEATRGNDVAALEHAAHALKGSVGVFGAQAAADASQTLELMGRNHDLANAEDAYTLLSSEMARLGTELAALEKDLRAEKAP
jgi:two-component system, sensor histidine kinase and response regulator